MAGWSRVVGELILEIEKLALQFAIGAFDFRSGIDDHMAFAAVDDDRVARFDELQQSANARNGGDAVAAGQQGGMAGLAAGLRGDPDEFAVAEQHDMRRQQFIGHDDQRLGQSFDLGMQHFRKMPADSENDIPHVGEPFADIGVFGFLEEGRVFLQHLVQREWGALMLIDDPRADFLGE